MSTQQFEYLVERIRDGFGSKNAAVGLSIYAPMEEGGMNFLSAEEEDAAGLLAFYDAVVSARDESLRCAGEEVLNHCGQTSSA